MQQGGSQYGAPPPDMTSFASSGTGNRTQVLGVSISEHLQQASPLAEAASPISSRPPLPLAGNFGELAGAAPAGFPDDDALAAAGEEADRGGVPGNRWPRQETLALLKIRSEMDAAFRDATLKAPLWEDVSRKLAELGYKRSAKKCKEKFENVHKYYKRTKDGRAGRQDGKSYRFFSQLEALHSSSSGGGASTTAASAITIQPPPVAATNAVSSIGIVGSSGMLHPTPLNTVPPAVETVPRVVPDPAASVPGPSGGISFSATSSSSASESEEDTEEGLTGEPRKRKRRSRGGGGGRKMMAFFEGLMTQVIERQEAMQQKFLEAIEKREQDRMIREEAWKRQEVARLNREHEMMAQERSMSASRDSAIIAFLQKMTGQTVPVPSPVPAAGPPQPPSQQNQSPPPASPPLPQQTRTPPPQRSQSQQQELQPPQPQQTVPAVTPVSTLEIVPVPEAAPEVVTVGGGCGTDPASSRWPKSEVHALIKLRSELELRYQEAGPKGPLWEEIAGRMQRMGYNRSSKRCKEKWENINKYFKKVKESNKKRPEDSKTCPYFQQLDALYRKKHLGSGGGVGSSLSNQSGQQLELAADPPPQQPLPPPQAETQDKKNEGGRSNKNGDGDRNSHGNPDGNGGSTETSNGGLKSSSCADEGTSGSGSVKKPEDIVKELMHQQQQRQQRHAVGGYKYKSAELDRDDTDQDCDEDEDEDEDEDGEMGFRIQYQQRAGGVSSTSKGGGSKLAAAAAVAGSFMAIMQ